MILVDTHVVVWLALDATQLSPKARAAIGQARKSEDGLAVSDITLLELTRLVSKERIRLEISLESFLQEVESRFTVLPITARACLMALKLPPAYPNDPADRIIGGTALAEDLPLITADRAIRQAKAALKTVW